jgi:hypothetical protein
MLDETFGGRPPLARWTGFAVMCGFAAALIVRRLVAPPRRRLTQDDRDQHRVK